MRAGEMESWGRYPRAMQAVQPVRWRTDLLPFDARPVLPRGQGRSYGDSCLNDGGVLLTTEGLDRFIYFDEVAGLLRCEAGVTLGSILDLTVPRGWFLPVLPGTQHVSVGGAIANDIHGKNHHRAGTFGCHVERLELVRSDGERRLLTPGEPLFAATVGGLGLTGLITWAELRLKRVPGPCVRTEAIAFDDLARFEELTRESDSKWEYTVAWIDCLARVPGRGVFFRGEHAEGAARPRSRRLTVPIDLPSFALNSLTVREASGALYAAKDATMSRATFLQSAPRLAEFAPFIDPAFSSSFWRRVNS